MLTGLIPFCNERFALENSQVTQSKELGERLTTDD